MNCLHIYDHTLRLDSLDLGLTDETLSIHGKECVRLCELFPSLTKRRQTHILQVLQKTTEESRGAIRDLEVHYEFRLHLMILADYIQKYLLTRYEIHITLFYHGSSSRLAEKVLGSDLNIRFLSCLKYKIFDTLLSLFRIISVLSQLIFICSSKMKQSDVLAIGFDGDHFSHFISTLSAQNKKSISVYKINNLSSLRLKIGLNFGNLRCFKNSLSDIYKLYNRYRPSVKENYLVLILIIVRAVLLQAIRSKVGAQIVIGHLEACPSGFLFVSQMHRSNIRAVIFPHGIQHPNSVDNIVSNEAEYWFWSDYHTSIVKIVDTARTHSGQHQVRGNPYFQKQSTLSDENSQPRAVLYCSEYLSKKRLFTSPFTETAFKSVITHLSEACRDNGLKLIYRGRLKDELSDWVNQNAVPLGIEISQGNSLQTDLDRVQIVSGVFTTALHEAALYGKRLLPINYLNDYDQRGFDKVFGNLYVKNRQELDSRLKELILETGYDDKFFSLHNRYFCNNAIANMRLDFKS